MVFIQRTPRVCGFCSDSCRSFTTSARAYRSTWRETSLDFFQGKLNIHIFKSRVDIVKFHLSILSLTHLQRFAVRPVNRVLYSGICLLGLRLFNYAIHTQDVVDIQRLDV